MPNPKNSSRLARILAVAAFAAAFPVRAFADEPQWVPVIVDQAASEQTIALVNAVATALRTKENVALLDPAIAARRFENVHSATPVEVPDGELRELGDSFRKALEAAALGQWDRAYELVRSFDALSQPVQDYVTWRLNLSRDIFDYCIMSVHFMLVDGREGAAREEMRNCIHSAPDRTLSAKATPEQVIQLHSAVKAELTAQGAASLDVDASGAPGAAAGCVVVVNGAPKGALPYRETGLLPVPVRIQVNCQRPGRIHVVRMKPGRNSLIVDLRFERVVRTEGYLSLRYGDAREEENSQIRDGLTLAKILDGSDLLLVRRTPDGRVALRRLGVQLEKLVSEISLAPKASADEIRTAAHALATSRSGPIAAVDEDSQVRAKDGGGDRDLYPGVALAVGSATGLAIAWGTYAESIRFRNQVADAEGCAVNGDIDVLCVQAFARYQTLGDLSLAFGALGSALGAATAPALLPESDGVPAWSWIAGAAGIGAATVGVVLWSKGDSCSLQDCDTDRLDPNLGRLLVLHAAPLLSVPITYGVRALLRTDRVEARAQYSPAGGSITVGGIF